MLLTTKAIEEKDLELYQKVLKDYRVPEDMISDIYYLFIKRMTAYKKNHQEINEVSSAFVNGAVKFIIRDLRKKSSSKKTKRKNFLLLSRKCFFIVSTLMIRKKPMIALKNFIHLCLAFQP